MPPTTIIIQPANASQPVQALLVVRVDGDAATEAIPAPFRRSYAATLDLPSWSARNLLSRTYDSCRAVIRDERVIETDRARCLDLPRERSSGRPVRRRHDPAAIAGCVLR